MPSASTKPEKVASAEATDPIKIALSVVDKKVRNLEKRKGKLDGYRAKADAGEILNRDQQDAIDRYDGVMQNLEFAKDLQKTFSQISVDGDKVFRKQAKREKIERQSFELRRMKELLNLQNLLDSMGSDKAREDFKSGKHNAVVLTDKDLNNLDELYKLISPTRDGEESYEDQLMAASEHLLHFLEAKDKAVLKTTYKDLKQMVTKIQQCGYFDQPHYEEAVEEPEPEQIEESETAPVESTYMDSQVEEETPEESAVEPQQPPAPQHQLPASHAPEVVEQPPQEEAPLSDNETSEQRMVDDAFFSTQAYTRQRPFQEIVSSVQGTFDFLQDSEIDMEAPHLQDPAVVAAHPMAPVQIPHPSQTQQTDGSLTSQQTYQSGGHLGNADQSHQTTQSSSHSQQQHESTNQQSTQANSQIPQSQQPNTNQSQLSSVVNQQSQQSSSLVGQQVALESAYASQQDYSQNLMSQSLPNSTSQYSDQSNYASQMSQPGLDQNMSAGRTSDVPPAIPLPSQGGHAGQTMDGSLDAQSVLQGQGMQDPSLNPQGLDQLGDNQEKKFPLNTNAAVFLSRYSQPTMSQAGQPAGPMMTDDKGINMQSEFHGAAFGTYNRNTTRGGPRGGNRGGRGGMNNGFNNSRGRGGTGAPFNNGRGGGFNGNRGGSNGRGAYQGYPPRSDYRPEGYQSFSSNNSFGGFPKRGGGGPPRGAPRGGAMSGNNNMRRGNNRGGARGGFGNPRPASGPPHQGQPMQQAAA